MPAAVPVVVFRDSVRLLIWYELVAVLLISAVEAVFAYRADWLSIAGLALVVLQFTFSGLHPVSWTELRQGT